MKILEKLQKRLQEGKKNNKGFSLVELIIVIAIMAILIGIVGMNIIPQIENARQSKDLQVLSAWLTESVQALTQNAANCKENTYTLTIKPAEATAAARVTTSAAADDAGGQAILTSFNELSGLGTAAPEFESNAGDSITEIKIVLSLSGTGEAATLTIVNGSDAAKAMVGDGLTSK